MTTESDLTSMATMIAKQAMDHFALHGLCPIPIKFVVEAEKKIITRDYDRKRFSCGIPTIPQIHALAVEEMAHTHDQ